MKTFLLWIPWATLQHAAALGAARGLTQWLAPGNEFIWCVTGVVIFSPVFHYSNGRLMLPTAFLAVLFYPLLILESWWFALPMVLVHAACASWMKINGLMDLRVWFKSQNWPRPW